MSIQWYPGHMNKARRLLAESIPSQDVIIEVLDARMPRASENPVVTELRKQKPCIKVLSKSDLADPEVTRAWRRWFEAERAERSTERRSGDALFLARVEGARQHDVTGRREQGRRRLGRRDLAAAQVLALTTSAPPSSHSVISVVRRAPNRFRVGRGRAALR